MNEREAAIKRASVKCPNCGGSDVVAGDPTGFACDTCGKKLRLKDFRRFAAENKTPAEKAKEKADEQATIEAILKAYAKDSGVQQ